MRNLIVIGALGLITAVSCDKVDNPFPPQYSTELNTSYYPGAWNDYVDNEWPDFSTITASANRNALIEDYTGHNCSNCPAAATVAHGLHEGNPERVLVASIHSSSQGMSSFQAVNATYNVDFTNPSGLEFGTFFGNLPNSGFFGNPSGTVNRTYLGTEIFYGSGAWSSQTNAVLASALKVAIKSKVNYYDQNKGGYLHTSVKILDNSVTNDLGMLVMMMQDTMVAPQNDQSVTVSNYVHRDIYRGDLSGLTWGRKLTNDMLVDGEYRLDYSFALPKQLAPQGQEGTYDYTNMHLLIAVYDKTTYEIYQVVKEKLY